MTNRAERLNGTVERRTVAFDFETRATKDGNLSFTGYASLFNAPYEMYGGPEKGGWLETVDPGAFKRTLNAKPDVVLLINHDGMPLARTTSKTMTLATDSKGLKVDAGLDTRDPDVQRLQVKMDRKDISQMSFAFRTIRQEWNAEETERRLMELELDRGDVSVVTNGAQPKTDSTLRSVEEALELLAHADLAEVRNTTKTLTAARRVLKAWLPASLRDADDDPAEIAQAIDAVLDAVEDALDAGNIEQAKALVEAAGLSVDALLVLLGVPDADDVLGANRSRGSATNVKIVGSRDGITDALQKVASLSTLTQFSHDEARDKRSGLALAMQQIEDEKAARHA